ncbi:MAG TPA: hypothetical protein VHX37_11220 [Acidobacteriaceae bacterium]|nr:hypothetical protein [Acidobacteriaceae bacterium]
MDFSIQYCPTRRDLEEHSWFLAGRLSSLTDQLLGLVGHDHNAFLVKKAECRDTRDEIRDSQRRLESHRTHHGC